MSSNNVLLKENEEYYQSMEEILNSFFVSDANVRCVGVPDIGFFAFFENSQRYKDVPQENIGKIGSQYKRCIAFLSYTTVSHLEQMRSILSAKGFDESNLNFDPFSTLSKIMIDEGQGPENQIFEPEGMQNYGFGLQVGEPPALFDQWANDQSRLTVVGPRDILRLLPPQPSRFGSQPLCNSAALSTEQHETNSGMPNLAPCPMLKVRDKKRGAFLFFYDKLSHSQDRFLAWSPDPDATLSQLLECESILDFRAGSIVLLQR